MNIPWLWNIIAVIAAGLLFLVPWIMTRGKGIGLGDVIVFPILTILLTPVELVLFFLFTVILAVIFGIVQRYLIRKKETFPLVPFMQLSIFILIPLRDFWLDLFGIMNLYLLQFS